MPFVQLFTEQRIVYQGLHVLDRSNIVLKMFQKSRYSGTRQSFECPLLRVVVMFRIGQRTVV